MKLVPIFFAAFFAQTDTSVSFWLDLVDKWGIAAVLGFIAWAMWKRDEKRYESGREEQSKLLREMITNQSETKEAITRLADSINRISPPK